MVNTDKIISGIFSGKLGTHNLPKDYYEDFTSKLSRAVKSGVGSAKKFSDLRGDLDVNTQAFAGAKTYNMVRELEDAKVLFPSKKEYKEAASTIIKKYDSWSDAEINTAKQQAMQAKQWQTIEEDADIFPYLRYSAIGDACKICRPLDGIIARVDSIIWRKIYPVNHYNCYCIVIQEGKGVRATSSTKVDRVVSESTDMMNKTFVSNAGITKKIYTKDHPYFASITKSEKDFARENFGLPIK
jgi:hypothetical protein